VYDLEKVGQLAVLYSKLFFTNDSLVRPNYSILTSYYIIIKVVIKTGLIVTINNFFEINWDF